MVKKNLKKGAILSETSFYIVEEVTPSGAKLIDDLGNEISISKKYIDDILNSADDFKSEEKKTMTELADLFINSPRIAMTVAFYKKDVAKTKTALKKEKEEMVEKFQNAKVSEIESLVQRFIDNPITTTIPGELRVMKGRHYGQIDDLGRVQFVDMELPKTDSAHRMRQVDPRTILYLIVNDIRYNLK